MATPCLLITFRMLYHSAFRGCSWMVHEKRRFRRLFYAPQNLWSLCLKPLLLVLVLFSFFRFKAKIEFRRKKAFTSKESGLGVSYILYNRPAKPVGFSRLFLFSVYVLFKHKTTECYFKLIIVFQSYCLISHCPVSVQLKNTLTS